MFAAYWADVDNRVEGTVRYQVFTTSETASANNRRKKATEEGNQLDIISEYIRESQNTDFIGKWALLVEWSDVHPYDHQFFSFFPFFFEGETADFLNSTNTFQAIIITDVFTTYVIYTYECGELEWSGPDFLHAVVGYNLPNVGLPNVGFMNEPLSGTPRILTIACQNRPISNFVNIVYQFQANPDLPIMRCLNAYSQDIQNFGPCLLYTSPSPRDRTRSRMPSSA